jgi:photosystem II stability/assembly factor-like uncharacterized protein
MNRTFATASKSQRSASLALMIFACSSMLGASEIPADDPAQQDAEKMPLANKALILDMSEGGDRGVAVGERGIVLVSESRRDWRQAERVPTQSNLTGVSAVGNKVWAVGHDGVIVHSADGGLNWERQRLSVFSKESDALTNGAPLLDVLFIDENQGFAVGAYAQLLSTVDGGKSWTARNILGKNEDEIIEESALDEAEASSENWTFDDSDLELEEETDPHLNGIARTSAGELFVVAERGAAFRSRDGGASFEKLRLPYEGSMFGVIAFGPGHVLCYGLRGNVFESRDLGDTWNKIDTGSNLSLMGGAALADGGFVLVGANGLVLSRENAQAALKTTNHPEGNVLAAVLALSAVEFSVSGETGMSVLQAAN